MMNELDEPFSEVDGAFKYSVEQLIPIYNLITLKPPECLGCDVVRSYESLISSETKYWSSREDVDKIISVKNKLVVLDCCVDLIVSFTQEKLMSGYC